MSARAIAEQVVGMQPRAQYAPEGVNPIITQNSYQAQQIAQRVAELQQPYITAEPAPMMTWGDYGYLLLAFIIFSVSLAIVRRQFGLLAKKSDARNAVRGRFGRLFGAAGAHGAGSGSDRPENVDNLGFGSDSRKSNQSQRDENLIGGDNESATGRKKGSLVSQGKNGVAMGLQYLQTSVSKVIGTKGKAKDSDEEAEDPCEYEILDDCNRERDRILNLQADQTKTVWTKEGPKRVDEQGNEVVRKPEESKSNNDVLDGSREGDDKESPVALLSAMDLNCDDDQINFALQPNESLESGSRGSSSTDDISQIDSSLPKSAAKKPARKAAVVVDNEPDHDHAGELSAATDQATISHVVEELNDLMIVNDAEINE